MNYTALPSPCQFVLSCGSINRPFQGRGRRCFGPTYASRSKVGAAWTTSSVVSRCDVSVDVQLRTTSQLLHAIGDVASLVAKSLARKNEFAILIDAPSELLSKPTFDVIGNAARGVERPSEHGFGIDFIDVLAARSRGARKVRRISSSVTWILDETRSIDRN